MGKSRGPERRISAGLIGLEELYSTAPRHSAPETGTATGDTRPKPTTGTATGYAKLKPPVAASISGANAKTTQRSFRQTATQTPKPQVTSSPDFL